MKPNHASPRFGLALLAASAGLVGGCRVGPDYAEPESPAPADYSNLDPGGFTTTSRLTPDDGPEASWWETLGDPTLNSLIDRAVKNNLDLRIATARIKEARAIRGIVATDALPALSVNGTAVRERSSGSTKQGQFAPGSRTGNFFDGSFDATWEIDVWGGNARAVEAADAGIGSSIESRRDVLVSLMGEVARAYVELRGSQSRFEIASKNIDLQQQTLKLTRSRFQAGLNSDLDVSQAASALAVTESFLPSFDAGIRSAMHRLSVLLGLPPTSLVEELEPVSPIPEAPPEVPVGIPSDLLRRRPDIRRAERDLAAATARVGVATADLFPKFSLSGSFGHQSSEASDWSDSEARFWAFGPAVRWPVFQWGRVYSAIGVENARTEAALAAYERTVLRAFEDVENAMVAFTREQGRRAALQSAVDFSGRAFKLAGQLYRSGLTDFQRVIDSQRSLQLTEDQLADSKRSVATSLVALYKALGGGWEVIEDRESRAGAAPHERPEGETSPPSPGDQTTPTGG